MAFRMDDRKQRLVVDADGGQGIGFFGWEMADAAALDAIAARLEKIGTQVARGSRALADERQVKDLIVCNDPGGNRLEFFHGAAIASDPFKPGRNISGFRTGTLGMGHVVMHCENLQRGDAVLPGGARVQAHRLLAAAVPRLLLPRQPAPPLHRAGRAPARTMIHHMMLELFSLDDVGQGYDLVQNDPDKIAVTMGRHSGDYVTSFYTWNPSGFMVEYGWGGQVIDDSTWKPFERKHGPSLWGHDRNWMSPEKREESRAALHRVAEAGLRQPVQVIDGNYNRMPGVCPWWDQMKAQKTG